MRERRASVRDPGRPEAHERHLWLMGDYQISKSSTARPAVPMFTVLNAGAPARIAARAIYLPVGLKRRLDGGREAQGQSGPDVAAKKMVAPRSAHASPKRAPSTVAINVRLAIVCIQSESGEMSPSEGLACRRGHV
jgi:hypothetical protein